MFKRPSKDIDEIIRNHEARLSPARRLFPRTLKESLRLIVQRAGLPALARDIGGLYFATYEGSKIVLAKLPGKPQRFKKITYTEPCCGGHKNDADLFRCMKKQGQEIKSIYLNIKDVGLFEALDNGWKLIECNLLEIEDQPMRKAA